MAEISRAELLSLPIDRQVLFTDKQGRASEKVQAAQLKLLQPMAPLLKAVLKPGEEVLWAARGSLPVSPWDQLLGGWVIYYLKACVLVLTSQRLLFVRADSKTRPTGPVSQAAFGDVQEAKVSGWLGASLRLKYKNGGPETFPNIKSGDAAKLKAVLPGLLKSGPPSPDGRRTQICGRCAAALLRDRFSCPACRLEFKNPGKASWLALLLPGGGYFYMGYPMFGVREILGEGIILMFVLMMLMAILQGKPGGAGLGLFLILLGVEKGHAVVQARKLAAEYYPADPSGIPGRGR